MGPSPWPEGTHVTVYLDDEGWALDDAGWKEMDEAIAQAKAGDVVSADIVMAELQALK